MKLPPDWVVPDWPAPARVRAFVTTRAGGVSQGEYASLNLGLASGDDPERVAANRRRVRLHLPSEPSWMIQVHGTTVADLDSVGDGETLRADAAVTSTANRVAAVLTADCLPVFLCLPDASRVAVAHAGWRGLAAGVLENALAALGGHTSQVLAWLGPAIGPQAFEVGPEVRAAFVCAPNEEAAGAFAACGADKYKADLYALARLRLARAGVHRVTGGGFCTCTQDRQFFSYRRVKASGRMGAFIWIDEGL